MNQRGVTEMKKERNGPEPEDPYPPKTPSRKRGGDGPPGQSPNDDRNGERDYPLKHGDDPTPDWSYRPGYRG